MNGEKKKAGIYIRVRTEDQARFLASNRINTKQKLLDFEKLLMRK